MNDKLTVSNTMKDVISPSTTEKDYIHKSFAPGFDPHGNHTKIEREEDLEIKGVNLVGSNKESLIPATHIGCAPRLFMVGDHMSQSNATKGVIVKVVPDDQLPTDMEGNKADLDVALPCLRTVGMSAAFDGDVLSGEDVMILVITKPKQPTNHQRHGYSRRKAKRAYQARYKYMLETSAFCDPLMSHLQTFDLPTRSDVHMEQFMGRVRSRSEVGSFMQPTKPTPHGKGNLNG